MYESAESDPQYPQKCPAHLKHLFQTGQLSGSKSSLSLMEPNGLKRITHRHTKLDHISANRLRSACVCVRVVLCRCGRHLLYQCFLLSCLVLFILLNENLALTMLTSDCAVSLTIMTMLIKVTLENLTHTFIVQHSVLLIHEASVVRITLHCF